MQGICCPATRRGRKRHPFRAPCARPFRPSGRTQSAVSPFTVATNAAVLPSGERAMPPRLLPKKKAPPSGGLIERRSTLASAAGWRKRDTVQPPSAASDQRCRDRCHPPAAALESAQRPPLASRLRQSTSTLRRDHLLSAIAFLALSPDISSPHDPAPEESSAEAKTSAADRLSRIFAIKLA